MSAPRTKRQFAGAASDPAQRRITSFFTSNGTTPSSASSGDVSPRGFSATDSTVQANLLSVGMRVRKAVPEGYKTAGYSAFSLWDESNRRHIPTNASPGASRTRPSAMSTPTELLPFCGIHKIGGLDTQTTFTADDFSFSLPSTDVPLGLLDPEDMDEVPSLTLSQDSVESNEMIRPDMSSAKTRKRNLGEEDEVPDVPNRLSVMGWEDFEVSPRSLAPVDLGNGRKLAVPRKGGLQAKLGTVGAVETLGQENVMLVDGDFEEAVFLDRSYEVEMHDF